jgi:hypothetical protein
MLGVVFVIAEYMEMRVPVSITTGYLDNKGATADIILPALGLAELAEGSDQGFEAVR